MRKKCRTLLTLLLALALTASLAAPAFADKMVYKPDGGVTIYDDNGNLLYDYGPEDVQPVDLTPTNGRLDVTALTDEDREALRNANKFSDVPADAWYAEAVNAMATTGLVSGYEDGTFHPNDNITVGEWCAILVRISTFENADITGKWTGPHWASGIVTSAQLMGLTRVNASKDTDAPHWKEDEPVNRGEAITAIVELSSGAIRKAESPNYTWCDHVYPPIYEKIVAAKKAAPGYRTWALEDIPDHEIIVANNSQYEQPDKFSGFTFVAHSWDEKHILKAYNDGLTSGVDSAGTCAPLNNLTRAEACQMLYTAGLTWCLNITPLGSMIGIFSPKS